MTGWDERTMLGLLMLSASLLWSMPGAHLAARLPAPDWQIVASPLSCPYLMPPDCTQPIPGP